MPNNITLAQAEKFREVCGSCEHWKPSRIPGFRTCRDPRHKFVTDSPIFLLDMCGKLRETVLG